ncbi:acetyl-CoA hydrolase/transferase C-terminal domain-containing protein [Coralloluteibacterium stylophorae]|uniref:Acetyl-CoA hydrolase n=2 Tax=Coralloluteibacterium stylophorae TaxID=1776034 RepID=A0AAP2CCQ3_9GAMM|nr:acetyl-CoA hydrolase/transferase C-terminal domain-containing protein [Coralloluteibacterium stylophorae]MBS7458383.1 acetyl-CoA hydrolase [Coralloluteibacterium stylophorae]
MQQVTTLDAAVEAILAHAGPALRIGAPLGIGKPHRLLNALYARVRDDPTLSLHVMTALSLSPPKPAPGLERRFLAPFLDRHFGADFPALDYVADRARDALPANVEIEEFYMQSGGLLGSAQAQADYASLNYTHVARDVASRRPNVVVQKVAREPGGTRLSASSNPDLSFDLLDEIARRGLPRPLLVAEVDPALPWLDGDCVIEAAFADLVVELPGPAPKLFALPRQPVSDADYAIGLYASALVRDGGTLQIGIGALADALAHALVLRHTRNDEYRALLDAFAPGLADSELVRGTGGTAPFEHGLYGASEMVNDGFRVLAEAGVLTRRVVDDERAMRRINRDEATHEDRLALEREGRWLDGAFYFGSSELYDWLRTLPPERARGLRMTRVSQVNQLYGRHELLEREQRRHARFFNTCMIATALGAVASDALEDGRVVSGVGGQYNFVAMAHALDDARSVLMLRATHGGGGRLTSSVRWNYGHTTIPRHLRDIVVTEYGIADLRGARDADCVAAMLAITDARFGEPIVEAARAARKLRPGMTLPDIRGNTPGRLRDRLAPYRGSGLLPDYPVGSDFTPVEQRLLKALAWLRGETATRAGKARAVLAALGNRAGADAEAMARMGLEHPQGLRGKLEAALLRLALVRTAPRR